MKKTFAVMAAVLMCQAAFAEGIKAGEAYAYPTLPNMTQGGIFVSLTNTDAQQIGWCHRQQNCGANHRAAYARE